MKSLTWIFQFAQIWTMQGTGMAFKFMSRCDLSQDVLTSATELVCLNCLCLIKVLAENPLISSLLYASFNFIALWKVLQNNSKSFYFLTDCHSHRLNEQLISKTHGAMTFFKGHPLLFHFLIKKLHENTFVESSSAGQKKSCVIVSVNFFYYYCDLMKVKTKESMLENGKRYTLWLNNILDRWCGRKRNDIKTRTNGACCVGKNWIEWENNNKHKVIQTWFLLKLYC